MMRVTGWTLLLWCSLAFAGNAETPDQTLNRVYTDVQARHAGNPVFLDRLKKAQRAWLRWRDAEVAAMYPDLADGTVTPGCAADFRAQLTQERIVRLKRWVDGVAEGEVCAGTLPHKQ